MTPTLYITRTGLLEPLGQSQVFAYLRGLSSDYSITLITYEKDVDFDNATAMHEARAACERCGIHWLPQRFRRRPKYLATALSILEMFRLSHREIRRSGTKLIHARSYVPAAVALALLRMTGTPFIFDMRALWPEELIASGRLRRDTALHRLIVRAERVCLRHSAAVVSLTRAAVDHLRGIYPTELVRKPIVVIPTCADLERFTPTSVKRSGTRIYGCIGTLLSGWFRTDWLATCFEVAAQRDPTAEFEIISRDDPARVRSLVDPSGRLGLRLSIRGLNPSEMPTAVRQHSLSVMFFTDGLSKLGSSPTRMGEVLGSGLPILANPGVGDVARILSEERVGALVNGTSKADMERGLDELDALLADRELPSRCRLAAERHFSLAAGTSAYRRLYDDILKVGDRR